MTRGRPAERDACPAFEEGISARLDGEDPGTSGDLLAAHLARCRSCRDFLNRAEHLHRRLRVRPVAGVADLTGAILDAIPARLAPRRRPRLGACLARGAPRLVAAGLTGAVLLAGAFVGGEHLAGGGGVGGGPVGPARQVAGSAGTSTRYPGAIVLPAGLAKPGLVLDDTAGHPYDIATDTAGRVVLVFFGYTHCPDVCPLNMALAAAALSRLSPAQAREVTVDFVTTDPARDTPAVIRAWLDRFDPSFVGLTGTDAQIHQAERAIDMPLSYTGNNGGQGPDAYGVVHAGYTLAYSRDGVAHLQLDGSEAPAEYAVTLRHLLAGGFDAS
ncbi:MAG: SCO family protein [Acidimicrobiales bacterium]